MTHPSYLAVVGRRAMVNSTAARAPSGVSAAQGQPGRAKAVAHPRVRRCILTPEKDTDGRHGGYSPPVASLLGQAACALVLSRTHQRCETPVHRRIAVCKVLCHFSAFFWRLLLAHLEHCLNRVYLHLEGPDSGR